MDIPQKRTGWSDRELEAAIDAYLKMLSREKNGEPVMKSIENQNLREGALSKRSASSIEYRMQNISAVLEQLDLPRIVGYMPAKNFGSRIGQRIRKILDEKEIPEQYESAPTANYVALIIRSTKLQKNKLQEEPKGNARPKKISITTTSYVRDPKIRAWVANSANGICEGCGQLAPFEVDGLPFLEIHHVKPLANKGSDSITNAVALCPNCHRRCHLSSDRESFKLSLYTKIKRLVAE